MALPMIAAAIAAIAGTMMQSMQAQKASKAVAAAQIAAQRRQNEYQKQASKAVMDRADDYKTENRMAQQADIQQGYKQDFDDVTNAAQAVHENQATTQGDVSSDYTNYKANADMRTRALADVFNNLMAKTSSAKELRLREGYKNADAASNVGLIKNFANGQANIDQMKIAEAANKGGTLGTIGGLAQSLGTAYLMGGGMGALGGAGGSAAGGANAGLGGGIGAGAVQAPRAYVPMGYLP